MSWLPSHRCFTPGPFTPEIAPIGGMLECSRFPSVVARLVLVAGHYCLPGPMSWSSVSGRPPSQPHAHDRGLTTRRMGAHFCAPTAAGGSTRARSYEAPPPRWRVDPRGKSPRG